MSVLKNNINAMYLEFPFEEEEHMSENKTVVNFCVGEQLDSLLQQLQHEDAESFTKSSTDFLVGSILLDSHRRFCDEFVQLSKDELRTSVEVTGKSHVYSTTRYGFLVGVSHLLKRFSGD